MYMYTATRYCYHELLSLSTWTRDQPHIYIFVSVHSGALSCFSQTTRTVPVPGAAGVLVFVSIAQQQFHVCGQFIAIAVVYFRNTKGIFIQ